VEYHYWSGEGGCPGAVSEHDRDRAAAAQIEYLRIETHILLMNNGLLKSLCGQAADALGKYGAYCPLPTEDIAHLIVELPKAAE